MKNKTEINELEIIERLKKKVMSGKEIDYDEAMTLYEIDAAKLKEAADEIRAFFCKDHFDTCGIISIKGGRCSENCRFCPQSSVSHTVVEQFDLLSKDQIIAKAKLLDEEGVGHVCLVSSGRRLSKKNIFTLCESIREIRNTMRIIPCASLGLIDEEDCRSLKEAGLVRLHNNLESSEEYFKTVCTSHRYEEKLKLLEAAKAAGLEICSGGLIGIGENRSDRIKMAMNIRKYKPESVPVNLLYPSKGSAMEDMQPLDAEEITKTFAVFRFIFPTSEVRLAAGRDLLEDTGLSCFKSGGNAAITGDCLTVKGISISEDKKQIGDLIRNEWS